MASIRRAGAASRLDDPASNERIDLLSREPKLPENLARVLADAGRARRCAFDLAVYLQRARYRVSIICRVLASLDDGAVRTQLWIVEHLRCSCDAAVRDACVVECTYELGQRALSD